PKARAAIMDAPIHGTPSRCVKGTQSWEAGCAPVGCQIASATPDGSARRTAAVSLQSVTRRPLRVMWRSRIFWPRTPVTMEAPIANRVAAAPAPRPASRSIARAIGLWPPPNKDETMRFPFVSSAELGRESAQAIDRQLLVGPGARSRILPKTPASSDLLDMPARSAAI